MNRTLPWLATPLLLACVHLAEAQQPKKMPVRIGYLSPQSGPSPALVAFKERLAELGWLEGKQINFAYRYAGSDLNKLSEFATELIHVKVDVIVTGPGNDAAHAAKIATPTIPIVMVIVVDPVGSGLVASLSKPGGNITGLTFDITPEQAGKNLELLWEAAPGVSPVAILRDLNTPIHLAYGNEAERVGKFLGIPVQFADVQVPSDKQLENAFAAIIRKRSQAVVVFAGSSFFADHRPQIVSFAARNKLPAIYPGSPYVDEGGLMSYGASIVGMWPRAATYVDKILKGAKPADLPVEQPTKFELVINLKTAKQIGLTIPPNVLARADKVIK